MIALTIKEGNGKSNNKTEERFHLPHKSYSKCLRQNYNLKGDTPSQWFKMNKRFLFTYFRIPNLKCNLECYIKYVQIQTNNSL